jgi:hypothetical protein
LNGTQVYSQIKTQFKHRYDIAFIDDADCRYWTKTDKQALQINVKDHNHHVNEEFEVNSFETLQFVAEKYNIPANKIAADLKVPERMTGEKLGRLKKQFSFTMVHSFWLSKLQVF